MNMPLLHTFYGLGFAAVFFCFAWLYKLALEEKDTLDLTPYEELSTRVHANMFLLVAAVPLMTVVMVWLPIPMAPMWAGMANFLIWPVTAFYGRKMQPQLSALKQAQGAAA